MKALFLLIINITVGVKFCAAQAIQVIVPGNAGAYSGINTNNMMVLSQSEVANANNPDVVGTPFWNDDWKTAVLYTADHAIFIPKVKLNLYTNDVWYTTPDSLVMVAKKGVIKGITFFRGNDTTSILANFIYLKNGNEENHRFYEFMNAGKAQLVKWDNVIIKKGLFDPFAGKSEQKYVTQTAYYLYYNSGLSLLKGANKETIFSVLQPGNSAKEWLDKSKNKLKSPSDILLFLEHFNTLKP